MHGELVGSVSTEEPVEYKCHQGLLVGVGCQGSIRGCQGVRRCQGHWRAGMECRY